MQSLSMEPASCLPFLMVLTAPTLSTLKLPPTAFESGLPERFAYEIRDLLQFFVLYVIYARIWPIYCSARVPYTALTPRAVSAMPEHAEQEHIQPFRYHRLGGQLEGQHCP